MKKALILDTETTAGPTKGNPFSNGNKLLYIGMLFGGRYEAMHMSDGVWGAEAVARIQRIVDEADVLVCFNSKFDCHWLLNIGVNLDNIRIYDCQYAEFLFCKQTTKYPSLDGTCEKYGLGKKIDVIKLEYWDKNIDTKDVPPELMFKYLAMDVELTNRLYLLQMEMFRGEQRSKYRLFLLHMEDQVALRDMERNGILYDVEGSLSAAENARVQIASVEEELRRGYELVPINFDSVDDMSAYLYGGTIDVDTRVPVGYFKTGAKVGQVRYKIVVHSYELPRLFEPLKGSELKKEGLFGTDDKTLQQLRGTKEAKGRLSLLDQRAKLEKLRGTYYGGFPKKINEMAWGDNMLHPTFNQCVAVTGRLSSTNPNGQNQPPESKQLCITRF